MNGARIHCCEKLLKWLSHQGIRVPFFARLLSFLQPIEIFFGQVKRELQRVYDTKHVDRHSAVKFAQMVCDVAWSHRNTSLASSFQHCGYGTPCRFKWEKPYQRYFSSINSEETHGES
jgi:hypothetical protein